VSEIKTCEIVNKKRQHAEEAYARGDSCCVSFNPEAIGKACGNHCATDWKTCQATIRRTIEER